MLLEKLKNFFHDSPQDDSNKELRSNTATQNDLSGDKPMLREISVEPTPNPNALKFIFEMPVIQADKVTFTSRYEAPHVPLVTALFNVPAVTQIHLFENVITVSKDDSRGWEEVEPEIKEVMHNLIDSHDPTFEIAAAQKAVSYEDLPPELREINEILDRTIRPGLQSDGGDLEILELKENNELVIRYEGACGSCPSSTSGTLYAIEGILKDEFHPDIKVVAG